MCASSPRSIDIVIPAFNAGATILGTLNRLQQIRCHIEARVSIIVVDDGSTDGTAHRLGRYSEDDINLVRHPQNQGRAAACNSGAARGKGEIIIFVDADCVPGPDDYLRRLTEPLRDSEGLCFGPVLASGDPFTERYHRELAEQRIERMARGQAALTFTTANMAITRGLFERSGGFDPAFGHYGFEDRDLLLRLQQLGAHMHLAPEARVLHRDELNLAQLAGKQRHSGQYSATRFALRHPEAYRTSPYYRVDCREHRWLRPLALVARGLVPTLCRLQALLRSGRLPFGLKRLLVQSVLALAYLDGTSRPPGTLQPPKE